MKKKLKLNKDVITKLTSSEQSKVLGGGTTSYGSCTGFLCCNPASGPQCTQLAGGSCSTLNPCD